MDVEDFDWLARVVRARSFSGAAKLEGVAVSTVARRIDALEAALRLRLLDRRPDGVAITPDGSRVLELAEPLLAAADRLRRGAQGMREDAARPMVTVSATEFVVAEFLAPALPLLAATHPLVRVELRAQTDTVSLATRDADLAVRMSYPEGASLLAKKLPRQELGLFGSAAYLAGRDPSVLDLANERLLTYNLSYGPIPEAIWADRAGFGAAVAMTTSSTQALVSAAKVGSGLAILPRPAARKAGLIEVATRFALPVRTPWLLVHRDLRRVREVAAVHRWIVAAFAQASRG